MKLLEKMIYYFNYKNRGHRPMRTDPEVQSAGPQFQWLGKKNEDVRLMWKRRIQMFSGIVTFLSRQTLRDCQLNNNKNNKIWEFQRLSSFNFFSRLEWHNIAPIHKVHLRMNKIQQKRGRKSISNAGLQFYARYFFRPIVGPVSRWPLRSTALRINATFFQGNANEEKKVIYPGKKSV